MGQITLKDLLGNHAAVLSVLAVGCGSVRLGIGKLWKSGGRLVAFKSEPDSGASSDNAGEIG